MSIVADLAKALADVRRPGDFFAAGVFDWRPPAISVEGVGEIAFPLLEAQAKQLIEVAQFAPFGRRSDTVVDPAVRNSWQIGAERVTIAGTRWKEALAAVVARVVDGLGVEGDVEASLYKLLIYEPGGFFLDHRDTEKARGMFATLIIAPPGRHKGGALIVRHGDREAKLELSAADPSEAAFAAFYADCPHEVLPVESGYRLVLTYNLVRKGSSPRPPDYGREAKKIAEALRSWSAAEDEPQKILYTLEHAYTPAELSFAALKGADQAAARTLTAAAREAGCDLHLALLTIEESGAAEYTENYGRRGRRDEAEFAAGEVFERSATLGNWRTVADAAADLPRMEVEADEMSPPGALDEAEADEEYFGEATGNEGASFERTYRRAALVLWPSERIFSVLAEADIDVALARLEAMVETASQGANLENARKFAGAIADRLGRSSRGYIASARRDPAIRLMEVLVRIDDIGGLESVFEDVLAARGFDGGDIEAVLAALARIPAARRERLWSPLFAGLSVRSFAAAATLLRRLADIENAEGMKAAAAHLARALARRPDDEPAWRVTPRDPEAIAVAFAALRRVDEVAAAEAAGLALADTKAFPIDGVLTPALLRLAESGDLAAGSPAIERLRSAALAHLTARASDPLAAPADWRRSATLGCKCETCADFKRFLVDPGRKEYSLRAAQHYRSHLEGEIKTAEADVDVRTLAKGSPHTLLATKNQKSYERRAKQRRQDLAALAVLAARPG